MAPEADADGTELPDRFQDGNVRLGSRDNAIIDESETEREWIRVENDGDEPDDVYWFDLREVSWERKTEILDDSLKTDSRTGEIELDLKGYYRSMMEEVIADSSIDGSLTVFLKGMRPELGDQLQEVVPQPGTVMDEMDEGNSETQ